MTMTTDPGNRSASQIERDVEAERARVAETLDELRHRMSPGQVVDQLVDYARDSGGGEFARNLGRSVRDNPLPILLIGAGIGWLMASGNHSHDGQVTDHRRSSLPTPPEQVPGRVGGGLGHDRYAGTSSRGGATHGVTSATGKVSDRASELGGKASSAAGRAGRSASQMASSAYQSAGSAAHRVGEATSSAAEYASAVMHDARDRATHAGEYAHRSWRHLAQEQPLVLGAMGFALGAALGAGLPSTRTEDRYLGHTSDSLKDQAREMAGEHYEHAKHVAGEKYEDVVEDLDRRGYSAESARQAAGTVGSKVRSAVDELASDAKEDVKSARNSASAATHSAAGGDKGVGVEAKRSSEAPTPATSSGQSKPDDKTMPAATRSPGSAQPGSLSGTATERSATSTTSGKPAGETS